MCCLVTTFILGIISQHSCWFSVCLIFACIDAFWKYWSVFERCMMLFKCWSLLSWKYWNFVYMQRYKLRERESEMNHAEAVQNEKILIGALAYKAVGEKSALDLLVLCWCGPIVLLWVSSKSREGGVSPLAGTCTAGNDFSCFIYSYSVAETYLHGAQLDLALLTCMLP